MPVSRKAHHAQLLATPPSRTRFVTRFGVSVLNVVATIDTPRSHHGAARPDVKNSAVLDPARRASTTAGTKESTTEAATMSQSRVVSRMRSGSREQGPVREATPYSLASADVGRRTTVSDTCDGKRREWCTPLCATTPWDSS